MIQFTEFSNNFSVKVNNFSEVATKKTVLVRKVTRGSPDSDDSFADESPDGYLGRGRDDQFLVSDRSENKFYGSVHGAPTGNAAPFDSIHLGIIGRKIEEYGYLCPGLFPWVNPGPATHESGKLHEMKKFRMNLPLSSLFLKSQYFSISIEGMHVTKLVGIMFVMVFFLDLLAAVGYTGTLSGFIYTILIVGIIAILLIISRQPQNRCVHFVLQNHSKYNFHEFFCFRYALAFLTPGLPFIPAIAITVNIYLIFKLSILTLVRFTVWMTLGLIMYFYYGITHSSLENANEEIELTVDQSYLTPQPQQKSNSNHYDNQTPTAVWDRHGYENKMAEDSWSTTAITNNYSTNSWDINDVNNSWSQPSTKQAPVTKQTITAKPTKTTTASSSRGGKPPPPPRPTKEPSVQSNQSTQPPKAGFSGIFIDETQFPSWDD